MTKQLESRQARKALDARLMGLPVPALSRPGGGYIRAIRDALQMTAADLAGRMGISQPAVHALEANERKGTIRLESLRRAAEAMDCDLVYAFVPKRGLEETLRHQVEQAAADQLRRVSHSMSLEDQGSPADRALFEETVSRLMTKRGIWSNR
mgnify:CR=1 FL=1